MLKNRLFAVIALSGLVGLAACGGDDEVIDDGAIATDTSLYTETDTELAPVMAPVTTVDTGAVVTTVETDVDVDTIARPNP
ncbi:MAG: hypothetical protein M3483_09240 [Gemmatimonadota bacterium]|nr:hypothetical protein [Gemmatimonadota bacterium]